MFIVFIGSIKIYFFIYQKGYHHSAFLIYTVATFGNRISKLLFARLEHKGRSKNEMNKGGTSIFSAVVAKVLCRVEQQVS